MSVLKCKMCGAPLNIEGNATVAICEYCGTKQTIPKLDDDRRANLYDRASHFRRNNEFDKAAGIYEQILAEDSTDAEAYWSLVLCRYGIEYVEDPETRKRIPTVNRTQMTSVYADENYKSAIRYADPMQRPVYEEEARTIDEIQKGILKISSQEEPFDIFICYKETDDRGRRTRDSVLANELYYQLKQEGYKVFFSRITLEDKLGSAYEPYIFAALNSAKVMVVLGTKPEYFNAVWVKNEWSRYLALIKAGKKKTLIPAYRDMDPYDLPEEFAYLQALDMSKLGFMQDLIRGIRKIIGADYIGNQNLQTNAMEAPTAFLQIAPLVERMFLFLEDADWEKAEEYTERILDQDPKNAMAYVGKLMAELHVPKKEQLAELKYSFASNKNYQRAVRFADKELKAELQGDLQAISERRTNEQQLAAYKIAIDKRNAARTEQDYLEAAGSFDRLGEYGNAREQAAWCRSQARINRAALEKKVAQEELRRAAALQAQAEENKRLYEKKIEEKEAETELDYEKAKKLAASNVIQDLADAAEIFRRLGSYKDSEELLAACEEGIRARKKKRKRKRVFWGLVLLIAGIIAGLQFGQLVITRISAYKSAVNLKSEGKIREAIEAFSSVRGYKDSESQIFLLETELLKQAKAGDTVLFGSYEQDNKDKNGQEAIEWQVLDKDGTKLLLVSKYALDNKYYNAGSSVTWETCSLRTWLNGTFLNNAFCTEEQQYILTSTVAADKNPNYGVDPGNDTRDKVFLLSITEAEQYFKSDSQRVCSPTAYALSQGVYQNSNGACWWCLRSPGHYGDYAACVNTVGSVYYPGYSASYVKRAVRPALWVDPIGNQESSNLPSGDPKSSVTTEETDSKQSEATGGDSLELPDVDAVSVGDIISFGHYEQDNNTNNGTEQIEWQVLDKDGTKLLLVSKYALDCQQYHSSYNSVTWETCSLRTWLNGTFLKTAFIKEEQKYILRTSVTADRNPSHGSYPGNDTKDKVFLLSINEVNKYFGSNDGRKCQGTRYCYAQGASKADKGNCCWWLRSPGYGSGSAAIVNDVGSVSENGYFVSHALSAVRPALWIDLARDQEPTDSSETESLATEKVIDETRRTASSVEKSMESITLILLEQGDDNSWHTMNRANGTVSISIPQNGTPIALVDILENLCGDEEIIFIEAECEDRYTEVYKNSDFSRVNLFVQDGIIHASSIEYPSYTLMGVVKLRIER